MIRILPLLLLLAPLVTHASVDESYICDVEQMAGFRFEDGQWRASELEKRNRYLIRPLTALDTYGAGDIRGRNSNSTHAIEVVSDPVVPLIFACEEFRGLITCTGGKFVLSLKTMKFEYAHLGLAMLSDDALTKLRTTPTPGLQWGFCAKE
jgi:hypothetical protein